MEELEKVVGKQTASGKLILAHEGSEANIGAMKERKRMGITTGLAPASSFPLGIRTDDIKAVLA